MKTNEDGQSATNESGLALGPMVVWVQDLARSKEFYSDVIGMEMGHEDATSVVMTVGNSMIIVVTLDSAAEMLLGANVATPMNQPLTGQLCLFVDDVDEWFENRRARGVEFLISPMDRSWGRRTAHLRDPDGWVWEVSQPL